MAVLMPEPQGTALGLTTVYADQYDPKLLFPISRNIGRDAIGDHDFIGTDIWRMYEFSWLNANGLPQAAEVDGILAFDHRVKIAQALSRQLCTNPICGRCRASCGDSEARPFQRRRRSG